MNIFFITALLLISPIAFAQASKTSSDQEIRYLLSYLESSNCKFSRNGTWYSPANAKSHLNRKYDYLQKKGLAPTAELFIKRAASESSTTGKPYLVHCEGKTIIASSEWFTKALNHYRK